MAVNVNDGKLEWQAILDDTQFGAKIKGIEKSIDDVGKNKGFEKQDQEVKKTIDSLEILKLQLKDYKAMQASATDPKLLKIYNKDIQEIEAEIKQMTNAGKEGFDSMGNAIKVTSKQATGLVGGLQRAWTAVSRIAYIIPGLGIAGLLTLAIGPLKKLIENGELFVKKLTDAQKEAKKLGEALDSSEYTNAISNLNKLKINLDLAKKGMYDKTAVVDVYNETIGKTAGFVNTLDEAEQGIADKSGDYIKMILNKAAANLVLEEAAMAVVEAEKMQLKEASEVVGFWGKRLSELKVIGSNFMEKFGADKQYDVYDRELEARKQKEIDRFRKTEEEKLAIAKSFQQKAADLASAMGGVLGLTKTGGGKTKADEEQQQAIDQAEKMYSRIESIRDEYYRKSLDKDEAEIQAVRDKFKVLISDITAFNNDPKNKVKIDVVEAEKLREDIISDLILKQEKIKAEKIEAERVKNFDRLMELTQTYDDKMLAAEKKYQDDLLALGENASEERERVLRGIRDKEMTDLQTGLVKDLDSYKYYFDNVAELSGKQLKEAIAALTKDLDKLLVKHPELKEFVDGLKEGFEKTDTAKTAKDFKEIASSLNFMAQSIGDFKGGLADTIRMAADLAGQVSNIKQDMEDFANFKEQGNMLGQLSSGIGIVGAMVSIGSVLADFLNSFSSVDTSRQDLIQSQIKATDGLTRALERQAKAANDAYGTQKIEEYNKAIEEAAKKQEANAKLLENRFAGPEFTGEDSFISMINRGENPFAGTGKAGEKLLSKLIKGLKDSGHQIEVTVEGINNLLNNGLLDEQTAKIAQGWLDAVDATKEYENAIKQIQTGVAFDSLADDFVNALTDENPFEKLGETFEDTMKQAILNSFKSTAFKDGMQKFYDDLNEASKGGLTAAEVEQLRADYIKMGEAEKARFDALAQVTGIDFTSDKKEQSGLRGAIDRMSEQTGSELTGIIRGQFDMTKQLVEIQKQNHSISRIGIDRLNEIQANTFRTANNTESLKRLEVIEYTLVKISNNTSSFQTDKDLGI